MLAVTAEDYIGPVVRMFHLPPLMVGAVTVFAVALDVHPPRGVMRRFLHRPVREVTGLGVTRLIFWPFLHHFSLAFFPTIPYRSGRRNRMLCRHCKSRKPNRPRGLCWTCYYTPGLRDQYPITSKFATVGVKDFNGRRPLPKPTDALPGTPEKVKVLCERARLLQALWHPLDAIIEDEVTLPSLVVPVGWHLKDEELSKTEPHHYRLLLDTRHYHVRK
jgi:hypothetical protein